MFLHPTVIAERTNVKSDTNAIYKIRVQTLLPIESVSAELDGHPVLITKSGPKQYSAEITDNGTMTITVHSFNGQTASRPTRFLTWIQKNRNLSAPIPKTESSIWKYGIPIPASTMTTFPDSHRFLTTKKRD